MYSKKDIGLSPVNSEVNYDNDENKSIRNYDNMTQHQVKLERTKTRDLL